MSFQKTMKHYKKHFGQFQAIKFLMQVAKIKLSSSSHLLKQFPMFWITSNR